MTLDWNGTEHLDPEDLARIIELVTSRLGGSWRPGKPTSQVDGGYYYDILDSSGVVRFQYGASAWLPGHAWRLAGEVVMENIPPKPDRFSKFPQLIDEEIMRAGKRALWQAELSRKGGEPGTANYEEGGFRHKWRDSRARLFKLVKDGNPSLGQQAVADKATEMAKEEIRAQLLAANPRMNGERLIAETEEQFRENYANGKSFFTLDDVRNDYREAARLGLGWVWEPANKLR